MTMANAKQMDLATSSGSSRSVHNRQAFDFTGQVAIVSGAGSRMDGEIGNGRACAILLARQGARVALLDNNLSWANETKRMIDSESNIDPTATAVIHVDVTSEASCRSAVEQTVSLFGTVHILINVVGVGGAEGDATNVDLEKWDRDMRINVTSMLLMSRFAILEMRRNAKEEADDQTGITRAIVNISSVSGLQGGNPNLLYPTSKGAIIQMTRAMAAQHGKEGIRINCVCPGMVYTPMVRGRGMTEEMRKKRIGQNLMGAEGTAWDVGYAVLFLASREAKWITGLIMPVDGGTTAGKSDRPALDNDTLVEGGTA